MSQVYLFLFYIIRLQFSVLDQSKTRNRQLTTCQKVMTADTAGGRVQIRLAGYHNTSVVLLRGFPFRDQSIRKLGFFKVGIIGAIEDEPYNHHGSYSWT